MAINRDKILKAAEKLVQKGKVEQAIKEYEKLLRANPSDANTINRIGDLYGRVGQVEKAIELYEKIADTFTQDGFATKAIAILKKINRLAPQRLEIFGRLAELYIGQGLVVEAKNQYQVMADWYVKEDDTANAIEIHKKLIQLDENNHMAHLRLADLLMKDGQSDEAIKVYDSLGRLLLDRGKLDEAERLYRHALDNSPPDSAFIAPLCNALLDAGRSATAREFLDDAIKITSNNHELQVIDVRLCLALGNVDIARNKADMILTSRPDDDSIRVLIGTAMISAGQGAEARDFLLPVAERKIGDGDFVGAQETIQDLVKAMPQDHQVLTVAVQAYEPTGDKEMAFTLKAALADSHFRSGQHDEARSHYVELLEVEPDNAFFQQRMAQINGVATDDAAPEVAEPAPEAALPEPVIEEISEPEPEPEPEAVAPEPAAAEEPAAAAAEPTGTFDPDERFAEANVFAKYGLVEKALSHFEVIVKEFPDHVKAREKLVFLLVEKGDLDAAAPVAEPLFDMYAKEGNTDSLEALQKALPGSGPSVVAAPAETEAPVAPVEAEVPIPQPTPEAPPAAEISDASLETADDVIVLDIDDGELDSVEFESFDVPAGHTTEAPAEAVVEVADVELVSVVEDDVPVEEESTPEDVAPPAEVVDEQPVVEEAEPEPEPVVEAAVPEPEPVPQPTPPPAAAAADARESTTVTGGALSQLDALERLVFDGPVPPPSEDPTKPRQIETTFSVQGEPPATAEAEVEVEVEAEVEVEPEPAPEPVEEPQEVAEEVVEPPPEAQEDLVEISDSLSGPPLGDLEHLDFFIQQELFEDAIRLLGRLEGDYPNDAEVNQRRLQLKSKGILLEEVTAVDDGGEELFEEEEDFFDLAKELEEELAEEEALVEEATGATKDEADLEDVFKEFQKGVAEQLSEEDADTHFNLGIAYKEMGLLAEAIREFQVASRDEGYFVESCSMIGVCYVEQGMFEQAAEWYGKATTAPGLPPDSMMGLQYEWASALESAGDPGRAVEIFEEIAISSPGFRDVNDRLSALSGGVN